MPVFTGGKEDGMDKLENVIKGLEEAVDWLSTETSFTVVDQWVVRDALELLKAQKPIAPLIVNGTMHIYCGNCNSVLCNKSDDDLPAYCSECGMAVKWG